MKQPCDLEGKIQEKSGCMSIPFNMVIGRIEKIGKLYNGLGVYERRQFGDKGCFFS